MFIISYDFSETAFSITVDCLTVDLLRFWSNNNETIMQKLLCAIAMQNGNESIRLMMLVKFHVHKKKSA